MDNPRYRELPPEGNAPNDDYHTPNSNAGSFTAFSGDPSPMADANFIAPVMENRGPEERLTYAKSIFKAVNKDLMLFILFAIGAQVVTYGIATILGSLGVYRSLPSWATLLITVLPLYLVAFPACLWMFSKIPDNAPRTRSLGIERFIKYAFVCMPIVYIGNLIGNLLSSLFSAGKAQNVLDIITVDFGPVHFLLMIIVAPILEELVFRKAIIDRIGRYGEATAIIFSALLFGLFHMNLYQFFYAFALGMMFAYIYINTGRIRYTIALHVLINFFGSFVASMVAGSIDEEVLMKIEMYREGVIGAGEMMQVLPKLLPLVLYEIVVFTCIIAGIILFAVNVKKIKIKQTPEQLPAGTRRAAAYGNPYFVISVVICVLGMLATIVLI